MTPFTAGRDASIPTPGTSRSAMSRAEGGERADPAAPLAAQLAVLAPPTLVLDAGGLLVNWNAAARQLFEPGADGALGQPAAAWCEGLAAPAPGDAAVPAFEVSTTPQRRRYRRGDGSVFLADTAVAPWRIGGERYLRLTLHALSERAEIEAALQAKRARHAALIESALDCIVSFDEDGTVIEFNQAAEQTFGHVRARALGCMVDELLFAPAHRALISRSITAMRVSGQATTVGHRIEAGALHADGHEIPVELSISGARIEGRCIFTAFLRDVTERRRSEAEVARLVDTLQGIFQLSPDGCVVFDGLGRVSDCNPAFAHMAGCRRNSLVGMSGAQFDHLLQSLLAPGQAFQPIDMLHDGALDTLELVRPRHQVLQRTVRRSAGASAQAMGKILYFRDVTQEREVDRMKSEFLSMAAHELRTPMVSIHGFSELLMTREFSAERRADLVATIHRQSSALIQLVNELLDLARIEARGGRDLHIGRHALAPLVAQTLQSLALGPAHRVELRLAPGLPPVNADPDKLHQVLLNVLGNALKYSPAGGCIVLEAGAERRKGRAMVRIEVSDPGIGMTAAQLERVFERFYRADPSGAIPGTGLGMAVVKEIVTLHQGEIEIDSQPGVGTRVRMWLPAAEADAAA